MDRLAMMRLCFPSRVATYSRLPAFDDYSEQCADDAPLRPYDAPDSPSSSRRTSVNSDAEHAPYDPSPSGKGVRELALEFAESAYGQSQHQAKSNAGDDKAAKSDAAAGEKTSKELSAAPRRKSVRFQQDAQGTVAPKSLPAPPSFSSSQVMFGQLSFPPRYTRGGYESIENREW